MDLQEIREMRTGRGNEIHGTNAIDWLIAEVDRLTETLELAEENGGLIVAERNRLTTTNADLQQRLDARPEFADSCAASSYKCEALVRAEEALKVAQGEVGKVGFVARCPWCGELPAITKNLGVYRLACLPTRCCPVEPRLQGVWCDPLEAIAEWNKWASVLTAANARVERLREALRFYGQHTRYCEKSEVPDDPCTCGYEAVFITEEA